jgi:hypothetical protein
MPIRIQRKRSKGWRMPPNTIYVGRGSKWGNPFTVANTGRVDALLRFACEVAPLLPVAELRGKNLACWCAPGDKCHADILLELANPSPPPGYLLKRPCKNCPFTPTETRIRFACKVRAEEIAESAYRNGFPCHLSAVDTSDDDEERGGYVFGEKTQHCAGAIMMFLRDQSGDPWPGIGNDEELAELLERYMDWKAPHYESEEDFIAKAVETRGGRRR